MGRPPLARSSSIATASNLPKFVKIVRTESVTLSREKEIFGKEHIPEGKTDKDTRNASSILSSSISLLPDPQSDYPIDGGSDFLFTQTGSNIFCKCGMGESNSRPQFGKLLLYHLTNPA